MWSSRKLRTQSWPVSIMSGSAKSILSILYWLRVLEDYLYWEPIRRWSHVPRAALLPDYIQVKLNYEACMSPIIMCHVICPGHIPIAEDLLENQFHRLFQNQVGWPQHVRTNISVLWNGTSVQLAMSPSKSGNFRRQFRPISLGSNPNWYHGATGDLTSWYWEVSGEYVRLISTCETWDLT